MSDVAKTKLPQFLSTHLFEQGFRDYIYKIEKWK